MQRLVGADLCVRPIPNRVGPVWERRFLNGNGLVGGWADTQVRPYQGYAVSISRPTLVGAHGMRSPPGPDTTALPRRTEAHSRGCWAGWRRFGIARGSRPGLNRTASPRPVGAGQHGVRRLI